MSTINALRSFKTCSSVIFSIEPSSEMQINGSWPSQPLRRTDLMKPQMVHRDDTITLVYEVPGILLTTRGKALESGAEGDVINVLNVESKRTIQGTVTGTNRVSILVSTAALRIPTTAASLPQTTASR